MSGTSAAMMLGSQAAGAIGSGIGAGFAASGQKAALSAEARVSEVNARMAELSAQSELLAGQRREQSARLRTAGIKSSQRVAMAANGVDLGSDTAINILTSTDVMGDIDANTIAADAVRSAFGYRAQGTSYKNEALMKRATAGAINPWMSGGSTLLTGAGQVAMNYASMSKLGMFDSGSTNIKWNGPRVGMID